MQTFLPYADFALSCAVLDDRRLGKQRVETFQILRALTWPRYAWKNHPAVRMWRGFVPALVAYRVESCAEWTRRGYADTVRHSLLVFTGGSVPDPAELRVRGQLPPWVGLAAVHLSHQSALVRKMPEHYRDLFPDVPDDLPYSWPTAAFPSWPVRRPAGSVLEREHALALLGVEPTGPAEVETVRAVAAGRDVLACVASASGARDLALLAALTTAGRTLWLAPSAGRVDDDALGAAAARTARSAPPDELAAAEPDEPEPRVGGGPPAAPPVLARPPSAEDVEAMRAEAAASPEVDFYPMSPLLDPQVARRLASFPPALVVIDSAAEADEAGAATLHASLASIGPTPVVALAGAASDSRRRELAELLGLTDPVWVGSGFDVPGPHLTVAVVRNDAARRTAVADQVEGAGPGIVRVLVAVGRSASPPGWSDAGCVPRRTTRTCGPAARRQSWPPGGRAGWTRWSSPPKAVPSSAGQRCGCS